MALLTSRSGGHPPPGMPDYDICEGEDYPDYNTYDEMTDNMSICSGSVNDILDHLNDEDLRNSADLDNLELEDMTIPDVINVNGNHKYMNGNNNRFNNSSKVTAGSKFPAGAKNPFGEMNMNGNMLSEYMDKLNQRSEREKEKKVSTSDQKKLIELADKSVNGSRDNCILSEFMQLRDAKFSKVTNDNEAVINDNTAKAALAAATDENRWSASNSRLSKSSSTYSMRSGSNNNSAYNTGSTVTSVSRNKTCPSPSFDARSLKNAKWSSTENIQAQDNGGGSFRDLPSTWTPRNQPSPSPDRRDFRPVNFDGNSLKRSKRNNSADVAAPNHGVVPGETFAWKDSTLDRELRAIKDKKFSDAPEPKNGRDGANDGLNRSLQNWANTPLPKPEDPDVILLKKARQEKKVKRYLEDNFKNREGHFTPEPDPDHDIGTLSSKYGLDRGDQDHDNSPPKSPPPFSKAESRFEREQRIKVGSLDSYTPGGTLQRQKSPSPPPAVSSAQTKYDRERFRVEPGRIENYTIGKGTLAQQESYKAGLTKSTGGGIEGCGITKYSGSHSFNPLLLSKSSNNLSIKKSSSVSDRQSLQKSYKDGYESDSTLSYRRHQFIPQQSENKSLYTQVQKGGDVPPQGLRMQAPDKKDYSRPSSVTSGGWNRQGDVRSDYQESEEELKRRQKHQLDVFYKSIDQRKETRLRNDLEARKHHDTLLPNQKSPVPLKRYDDEDTDGNQALFLNAGKKPADCKSVAKALFNFKAQNSRELSFRKGDVIYIKRQVDNNWYEGERNAAVGIFPVSYVEILPNNTDTSTLTKKEVNYDGQAKAKFNFTAQSPMELSLIKGEMVTLTRRIDKNWYEGRIGSRKGILPVSYVEVLADPKDSGNNSGTLLPKPAAAPAAHSILRNGSVASSSYVPTFEKQKPMVKAGSASPYSTLSRPGSSFSNGKPEPTPYRALYNYKPQNEDEVELCEGDIVYVMEKCDDGWFVGTSQRTGIFGTFPGNYVTQV